MGNLDDDGNHTKYVRIEECMTAIHARRIHNPLSSHIVRIRFQAIAKSKCIEITIGKKKNICSEKCYTIY